jgi:hypothetical protein
MNVQRGFLSAATFAAVALAAPAARALTFDYCNFSNVSTLTLNGNAAQLTNTLELTANQMNQAGSAFRTAAVAWTTTTSFHTYFTFEMSPGAAGADGISFILQNSLAGAAALGHTGGALGYGSDTGTGINVGGIGTSVEVEFDTYQNTWDTNANHVGIMENGANETHLATGTPAFTMANGGTLHAWIDYVAATTTLSVYVAQTATKPATALVSLGTVNVATVVGAQAFLGFTGGTGGSTNLQQIFEWEFSTDGEPCSCDGNSACAGAAPVCAPAGDPEAGLCVGCSTDAECDSNVNTPTPVCSKAAASVDTCVACGSNADCAAAGLQPVCATSGAFLGQCVMCATMADCAGNAAGPFCLAEAATNACVQCETGANCAGATPVCNAATHKCQACATDTDCSAPTPACQTSGALAGQCTQCSSTTLIACVGASSVCDSQTGTCVGCQTNADCAGSSPICNLSTNTCRACQSSTDCASFSGDPVCATTGTRQGQCVVCQADTDCPGTESICNPATNACTGCVKSTDCSGDTPVCNATAGTCLACTTDPECAAIVRTGTQLPLCQTTGPSAGSCVQCRVNSDCSAGEMCTGGLCVAEVVDAGSSDASADGGVADGGHPDGGVFADGGNGDGSAADGGESPDATLESDGSAVDSGVGSEPFDLEEGSVEGGEAGSEAGQTASNDGGNQAGDVAGGGCACSSPGTLSPSGAGGPLGLLLALAVMAGRRKRG